MKLSIIVPIYNKEKYLADTLQSLYLAIVESQQDIEVIMIDDESTDGSAAIANRFVSSYPNYFKYHYIKHEGGYGPANARNVGFKYATGDYVMFFDADDSILSGYVSRAISHMDTHPDCNLYIEPEWDFFEIGSNTIPIPINVDISKPDYILQIINDTPIMLYGVMRTELVWKQAEKFGLFEETFYEDIKFTALYLILFGGLYVDYNHYARVYRVGVENSVCSYHDKDLKLLPGGWTVDYHKWLTDKLSDYGFYIREFSDGIEYSLPHPKIYFE